MPIPPHSIFINYRRADSAYAVGRLYQCLAQAFGPDVAFCDFDSIPPGAGFPDSIRRALTGCRVILPVIGKDWLRLLQERTHDGTPDWVREELEIACRRWQTQTDGRLLVYPLLLLGAQMPQEKELPPSRQPVVELQDRAGAAVVQQELMRLDGAAGAALLRDLAVRGTERELRSAVEEYHGHAYSLMLLGTYLGVRLNHDIRRRREIPLLKNPDPSSRLPAHSRRMFRAYVAHLGERSPEVAVLRLLGFFDRAAEQTLVEVLRAYDAENGTPAGKPSLADKVRRLLAWLGLVRPDGIGHLTAPLADMSGDACQELLDRLAELRLIHFHDRQGVGQDPVSAARTDRASMDGAIDSHALLREYFAEELRTRFPAAWRAGHRRLYEHLTATTEPRPDTIEGLQPLYQAVAHGCLAGLQQQARADVYRDRILRGAGYDGFYSTKKLGAFGADLGALACFFETPWTTVSPNLTPADQAWLLNAAAVRLRALGRLTEALAPMRDGLARAVEVEAWNNAAPRASNLSELELTRGAVSAAVTAGQQSVTYADRSGDAFQRMGNRTTQADALHQAGRADEAQRLFEQAEAIQAEDQPQYPQLYSLQGFRYCDLLLSAAECAAWRATLKLSLQHAPECAPAEAEDKLKRELQQTCAGVIERADYAFKIAERNRAPVLTIALDHLTLGRAALYRAIILQSEILKSRIAEHLAAAVHGLRAAGQMHYLPLGLLTRAWLRHLLGDVAGSREDLDEAWEIAERGPMPLLQIDILLHRARLFAHAQPYPWAPRTTRADLDLARRLVETHGYHRRDAELADAQQAAPSRPA